MENATKALLIAGSILIVVLITAFGMSIFNKASDAGNTEEISGEMASGINKGNISLLYNNIISITGYPNGSVKRIRKEEIATLERLVELVDRYNKNTEEEYKIYLPFFFNGTPYNPYNISNNKNMANAAKKSGADIIYFKVLDQGYEVGDKNVKLGIFFTDQKKLAEKANTDSTYPAR